MAESTAERVATALEAARGLLPDVVDLTIQLAQIPAPTGVEGERSRFVARWLRERGFTDVWEDTLGDLTVRVPGTGPGEAVLIAAHLDTVFPAGTDLTVRRSESRLHGPGVGDNSLGVATMLLLPELLDRIEVRPAVDVVLALTVGEEGLGNLRGMRSVFETHQGIGAAIALEGHNLGRVTHMAVGSRRLKIVVTGPGGHSWGAFGQPSAIHVLAKIVAELDALPLTESPKTTLNVGLIEGGVSVNTIAPAASCVVDLRSTDEAALARLVGRVDGIVRAAARGGVSTESIVLGDRPAGTVARRSRIVQIATEALRSLGHDAVFDASSTDANIPISLGIPAICLGITNGENAHREDEYIDIPPVAAGMTQLLVTTLNLADDLAAASSATLGTR